MQSWLISRQEQLRFASMVRVWKKENPKSTLIQEMIIESLLRMHLWEQRLCNRKYFFDGTPSSYVQVRDREIDVMSDDLEIQTREFDKYMPQVQRWKNDLLKLALANNVSLQITGDAGNVSALFGALDERDGKKLIDSGSNGKTKRF